MVSSIIDLARASVAPTETHETPPPSAGQIDVERAIAEIRAGRPVILKDAESQIVVFGVECLAAALTGAGRAAARRGSRLILTAPRLRQLGLDRREPGLVAVPAIDLARINALAQGVGARIDAPVTAPSPIHLGALELLRLAHVLPAALVIPATGASSRRGLLAAAVAEVSGYRVARAKSLNIVGRAPVPLDGAPDTEFVVFRGGEGLRDQVAVIIGKPDYSGPVTVRLHSACLTGDLFGSLKCDCGDQLRHTARFMAQNGGGVLLYIDQEGRGNGLSNKIRAYELQARGYDTYDADAVLGFDHDQRRFDFAADMLRKLGVARVRIMTNNPVKIAALENAGINVVSDQRVIGRKTAHNQRYLASKRDRSGHLLEQDL
ncbi:MAG: GTP cyclohydrolase II RibA [Roseiarcus sp.]